MNSIEANPSASATLFSIYNVGSQFNSLGAGNPVLGRERRLTIKFTYSFIR